MNVQDIIALGLNLFAAWKSDEFKSAPESECRCDPAKFLANADCPVHLMAKGFDGEKCISCGGENLVHPALRICLKCIGANS